jgi:AraC-like DNA-binding protein
VAAWHAHPAWKVVVCPQGLVTVEHAHGAFTAPGVKVPPGLPHRATSSAPFRAAFIDPWLVGRDDRDLTGLTTAEATCLHAALPERFEALFGPPEPIDPRVTRAIEALAATRSITDLAASVGLSAPRLRSLVREHIGVPLTHLRRWQRLRQALASLDDVSVARAGAGAGFADQAHFTRVSRALLGRTPGSLMRTR